MSEEPTNVTPLFALAPDPDDPEDAPVTHEAVKRALAERRHRKLFAPRGME